MIKHHHRLVDPLIALGVGLAAFALYLRTLAPGLLWGDSAEFQFAAWLGGFAHPTGYPLYLILGWLWTHLLPFGDPAWRMNLFSALWGGVAVGLVYLVVLRILQAKRPTPPSPLPSSEGGDASPSPERRGGWGVRLPAATAALVFAVTPTFWSQAVVAEVYTLNAAFVAAILLAALAWADRSAGTSGWPRLYLLAGLVGLSLAHHRTTLLLLPGVAVFLWLAWERQISISGTFANTAHEKAAEHPFDELRASSERSTAVRSRRSGAASRQSPHPLRLRSGHASTGHTSLRLLAGGPAQDAGVFSEQMDMRRAGPWPMKMRRRLADGRRQTADGGRRTADGGQRSAFSEQMDMRRAAPRGMKKPNQANQGDLRPLFSEQPIAVRAAGLPRRLLTVAALLLAPLLLYAYIPLVAPRTPYFTVVFGPGQTLALYEPTLRGFLAHISGSIFQSALGAARGPWLADLAGRLAGELTWPGAALGVIGIGWLAWRDRRTLTLTGLSFLAFVLFNAFYAIGDIYVFYVPVYLIWVVWLAVGAAAAGQGLIAWTGGFSRFGARRKIPAKASTSDDLTSVTTLAMSVLLLALAGWLLNANFARLDRSADRTARAAWDAVLAQAVPQDAILITNDRDEMVPQWYLRYVEGRRPDITGLFPLIQPGPAWSDVAVVTGQALQTGRPVYLIKPMPGLEVRFALAPVDRAAGEQIGALVRVLGPAAESKLANDSAATFGEQIRLAGYEARPAEVSAGQPLDVILDWEPLAVLAHDYTTFVHLVNAEGRVIGQSDHRPGGAYYPTSLWRVGDRLRDVHQLSIAKDLGSGPYVLEVGLYRLAPDLQHLGSPQRVGALESCG